MGSEIATHAVVADFFVRFTGGAVVEGFAVLEAAAGEVEHPVAVSDPLTPDAVIMYAPAHWAWRRRGARVIIVL